MEETLQSFINQGVFAFILTFVRVGTAVSLMPGLGDVFTPRHIRLYIALGLSLVLTPVTQPFLPHPAPENSTLIILVGMEFLIGAFIGMVTSFFLSALDTAGMLISMASGLGSAQLFQPRFPDAGFAGRHVPDFNGRRAGLRHQPAQIYVRGGARQLPDVPGRPAAGHRLNGGDAGEASV